MKYGSIKVAQGHSIKVTDIIGLVGSTGSRPAAPALRDPPGWRAGGPVRLAEGERELTGVTASNHTAVSRAARRRRARSEATQHRCVRRQFHIASSRH